MQTSILFKVSTNSFFCQRWVISNSPFRLTSLIYAEKFEFHNLAIMEDKQYKQTGRFSVMTKGIDYFLSLDDNSI